MKLKHWQAGDLSRKHKVGVFCDAYECDMQESQQRNASTAANLQNATLIFPNTHTHTTVKQTKTIIFVLRDQSFWNLSSQRECWHAPKLRPNLFWWQMPANSRMALKRLSGPYTKSLNQCTLSLREVCIRTETESLSLFVKFAFFCFDRALEGALCVARVLEEWPKNQAFSQQTPKPSAVCLRKRVSKSTCLMTWSFRSLKGFVTACSRFIAKLY